MLSRSRQTSCGLSPAAAIAAKAEPSPTSSQPISRGTGTQGACEEISATCAKSGAPSCPRSSRSAAARVNWSGMVTQLKGGPR